MRLVLCFALVLSAQVAPLQEGIQAMARGEDARAVDAFTRAVQSDPQNVQAWMFLGGLYTKAGDTARAEDALQSAQRAQPDNPQVLEALGTFYFAQKNYDRATEHFERLGAAQPTRKETQIWLGRIAFDRSRVDRANASTHIDYGIRAAERALAIDPNYNAAFHLMAQLLQDRDPAAAKQWLAKATQPTTMARPAVIPGQIRVGGNVQAARLVRNPAPVYPPTAEQARIQGVVRFNVVIGKDGRITNLTLVSGHPLLVQSATEAAQQYEYQPTLLNGQAVEVVTQVDVNFTLPAR